MQPQVGRKGQDLRSAQWYSAEVKFTTRGVAEVTAHNMRMSRRRHYRSDTVTLRRCERLTAAKGKDPVGKYNARRRHLGRRMKARIATLATLGACTALVLLTSAVALGQPLSPTPVPTFSPPASDQGRAQEDSVTDPLAASGEQQAVSAATRPGTASPEDTPSAAEGFDLSSLTTALVSAAIAAVLTWAFTRSIERAKQQEAFKVALVQKRVDTALHVQAELNKLAGEFMDSAADCHDEAALRDCYLRTRRKIVTLMGQTAFTNPLLYGYVNGLLREDFLYEVEEKNRGSGLIEAHREYRYALRFMNLGYSLALYRSTQAVWDFEPGTAGLGAVEALAGRDVREWHAIGHDMSRYESVLEKLSAEELGAIIAKSSAPVARAGAVA
jgi:hypothetical protein